MEYENVIVNSYAKIKKWIKFLKYPSIKNKKIIWIRVNNLNKYRKYKLITETTYKQNKEIY